MKKWTWKSAIQKLVDIEHMEAAHAVMAFKDKCGTKRGWDGALRRTCPLSWSLLFEVPT